MNDSEFRSRAALPASTQPSDPTFERVARLVDNHRAFLDFLERKVGSRALAEDILQDAFVRGMDKLSSLREDESAVAWFYRVLRNSVIDHARRRASEQRRLSAFAEELETQSGEAHADTTASVCQCVSRLAADLKPDYAEAVQRLDVEGMELSQFAAQAGITTNNAAVRAFRARTALRKRVQETCATCAEHGCVACTCGSP